jgi:hypothetical protein
MNSTIQPNYLILNAATGSDVAVSEGSVVFGATTNVSNPIAVKNITKITSQLFAAGTNQVVEVTVPASVVASTTYSFQILLQNSLGEYYAVYVEYVTAASGDTTTTVRNGLKAALDAYITTGYATVTSGTSGGNILTITGTATTRSFVTEAMLGGLTVAITTAGVATFGTGASLVAQGIVGMGTSQPAAGTNYSLALVEYSGLVTDGNTIEREQQGSLYIYYISSGTTFLTAGIQDKLTAPAALANVQAIVAVPSQP